MLNIMPLTKKFHNCNSMSSSRYLSEPYVSISHQEQVLYQVRQKINKNQSSLISSQWIIQVDIHTYEDHTVGKMLMKDI